MKRSIFFFLIPILFFDLAPAQAQEMDVLLKGAHLIDPKNKIDGKMDVAFLEGKIIQVSPVITPGKNTKVIDVTGFYVAPGFIDMHAHVFNGTDTDAYIANGLTAVPPDGFTFRAGVTTAVDAGSSGWRNFPEFKKQTIDHAKTRILALLNIVGTGMFSRYKEQDVSDMNPVMTANMIKKLYPTIIVGIKAAHYWGDFTQVDMAVEAGKLAHVPVMVDFGGSKPPLSIQELFERHLRPGDVFTHCFGQLKGREAIVDIQTKKVKPFVLAARERGIIFDVGYGGISFAFSQAVPAVKNGFFPNSISTDLHIGSMNNAMKDMLSVMSKFLTMGMDLNAVIAASTANPAREIKRESLGNLSVGSGADIAIFSMRKGQFGYFDYTGYKIPGSQRIECEMTIKAGKIVYDLNGLAYTFYR